MAAIPSPSNMARIFRPLNHRPTPFSKANKMSKSLSRWLAISAAQESSTPPVVQVTRDKRTNVDNDSSWLGPGIDMEGDGGLTEKRVKVKDYFEEAGIMVRATKKDGSGPRWFSPVECGVPRLKGVPLLLYLPGMDGVGLGLVRQHGKLGKIFEVWCLHIPVINQKPFAELVKLVDCTVRSEYNRSPNRPIYLVGDSLGACLALAVAARNQDIDLALILVNPATSFRKSSLQQLLSLLVSPPIQSLLSIPPLLNPMTGDGVYMVRLLDAVEESIMQPQAVKDLIHGLRSLSSYYSVIAEIFFSRTLPLSMEMLQSACAQANSRLHSIKNQTLILTSGNDPLLPNIEEGARLLSALSKSEIRKFSDNGHFLLLEDGVDLVSILKGSRFYRRRRTLDYVTDFLPPTPSEFKIIQDQYRWLDTMVSPVMFSTLENGKIVRGLEGLPSQGPTLLVGNHMLLGFDAWLLVEQILAKKNILARGLAHPAIFFRNRRGEGKLPDLSAFDSYRLMGAVPVSATNIFKLLATKSHVLLYPGGFREAFHRKGEEHKLFWPEQSEFVRMTARFEATIVPFGVVGEDDIGQLVFDYDDLMKIPYFKAEIEEAMQEITQLRVDSSDEVSNQQIYLPRILPKVPGRVYFLLGKPLETKGRKHELKDRHRAQELYMQVKAEVESCITYLQMKRENDPYRSILARLAYLTVDGYSSEIPTFEP